jgi:hypothetical protein
MRGGGIAGPRGDTDRDLAGEPGEYHHSKNLMKNIAVGRRSLSESSNVRGDLASISFKRARIVRGGSRVNVCWLVGS